MYICVLLMSMCVCLCAHVRECMCNLLPLPAAGYIRCLCCSYLSKCKPVGLSVGRLEGAIPVVGVGVYQGVGVLKHDVVGESRSVVLWSRRTGEG